MAATVLPAVSGDFMIEEIIVTAQKREQNIQDVPVAISSFDASFLEDSNINNVNQLVTFTPGLAGQSQGFQGLESFSVRGISTNDFGAGGDLSVGIYVDGVYQPRNGGVIGFFDMDRVEVLKGPQGLLFGRNASSGAISMITRKPTNDFEAEFSVGIEERNGNNFTGVVNLPISDDLAMRVAVQHEESQGYVDNIITDGVAYGRNNDSVRFSTSYLGFSDTEITLSLDYEDRESSSGEIFRHKVTLLSEVDFSLIDPSLVQPNDPYKTKNNFSGGEDWEHWGGSLEVKTDLTDELTLTSITGFRNHNNDYSEDYDSLPLTALHFFQQQSGEYYSQEFRLTGGNDTLTWFAGISGYKEKINATYTLNGNEDDICIATLGADCVTLAGFTGDPDLDALLAHVVVTPGTDMTDISTIAGNNSGWGAFGEMTLGFAEDLNLSLGLRYTYDKKDYSRNVFLPNNPIAIVGGNNGGYSTSEELARSDSWNDISPRAALTYHPNENVTLYTSVSKGYKSGGFDTFGLAGVGALPTLLGGPEISNPNSLNSFDQETIISYEIGIKSIWWDNRLQANASAYVYEYNDLQLNRRVGNSFVVNNVGEAEGRGVELDLRVLPTDYLDVLVGVSYADTETNLDKNEENEICEGPCSGGRLPYNPRWSVNSVVTYHTNIDTLGEFFTTLEYSYQDETLGELNGQKQDSYSIINLRAGLNGDNWSATLYLENATDEEFYNFSNNSFSAGISRPRTAGLTFSYKL